MIQIALFRWFTLRSISLAPSLVSFVTEHEKSFEPCAAEPRHELAETKKKNIELWQQLREEKENAICLRPQPESSSELDLKWKNIHLSDWEKKSVNWFGLWKNIFFFAFAPAPSGFCTANMYSPYTQHRQIINIKYQIPKPRPILEIYFLDAALRVSNPNHRKSISLTPPRTQPWMGLVRRAKRLAHEPPQPWLCRKKYKIAA